MEEESKEEFYTEPMQVKMPFEPLKARAYHINQQAIDVCNERELVPAETIVALSEIVKHHTTFIDEQRKMIESLKSIVPTDGRPVYTLQEFGDVMRKVTQVEGVTLNEKQKGFFREIFASLTKCIADKGLMRQ